MYYNYYAKTPFFLLFLAVGFGCVLLLLTVMEIVKLANILFNVHIVTIVPDVLKLSQMCDIM